MLLAGCGQSGQRDARAGVIEAGAPVKAMCQIVIAAPPAKLWAILTDVAHWPEWQPDISAVAVNGPIRDQAAFSWSAGSGVIHSQVAVFDPPQRLGWTGRLFIFHAIHLWILQPLPGGQTRVQISESLSGWPIGWLISSAELRDADQNWLEYLKKKAEANPG